jgi:DNA-binding MarR family transcriptional regulator
MVILDREAEIFCEKLLEDVKSKNYENRSLTFFRRDITTLIIWLFIISSYVKKNIINIEDIAREVSSATKISKPSLRLILEKAKQKGFIKFTHNQEDTRSWIIEPEMITLSEFNTWAKKFS